MRRVVVTGIGLLTPLGQGREITWKAILAGRSGAGRITTFDPEGYACQIACEVPRVDGRGGGGPEVEGSFDPDSTLPPKDQRRVDDFILYAIAAADEAVTDSGWKPETAEDYERTGVIIGSGIGGLSTIADTAIELHEKGPRRVSPFFIPSALINLASGQVSIRHGFKGPNHSVVTACATGAHAIAEGEDAGPGLAAVTDLRDVEAETGKPALDGVGVGGAPGEAVEVVGPVRGLGLTQPQDDLHDQAPAGKEHLPGAPGGIGPVQPKVEAQARAPERQGPVSRAGGDDHVVQGADGRGFRHRRRRQAGAVSGHEGQVETARRSRVQADQAAVAEGGLLAHQ